jgi:IclR family acetate operon transcriptional repressor
VKNVINCLRLLDEVAEHQPIGVGELSRRVGLPKSTTQRALLTLEEAGWIKPGDGGSEFTRWTMTTKALELSRRGEDVTLRDLALPVMEELREQTQETIHLMVARETNIVLIERLQTPKPVRIVLALGTSMPIYASATGKAVLAASPPHTVERVIDSRLSRFTRTTVADPAALRAELACIRRLGYATNNGEWRDDVSAVAAAVVDAGGTPVASLSVSMPSSRMPVDCDELGAQVMAAAAALTSMLAAHRVNQ